MTAFPFYIIPGPFLRVVENLVTLPFVFHAMVFTTMLGLIFH